MFCLRAPTDLAWARAAVRDLDHLLVDHAHCEMKAASNALSLVVRHPGDLALVRALTELAREELDHFQRVVDFLERRGLSLGAPPVDDYAAELRAAMKRLPREGFFADAALDSPRLVDRLLVGALIEARSCERFKLLLEALPEGTSEELRAFYRELFEVEARHYRAYVDLGTRAAQASFPDREAVEIEAAITRRLNVLAEAEGAIVTSLSTRDARATVHG